MSEEPPNPLEMKALHEALAGPEPWKESLRTQIAGLLVIRREDTVVGGYTHFRLGGVFPLATVPPNTSGYPAAIDVRHPELPNGGAFLVWTDQGQVSLLEYYENADGVWPKYHDGCVDDFEFYRLS